MKCIRVLATFLNIALAVWLLDIFFQPGERTVRQEARRVSATAKS